MMNRESFAQLLSRPDRIRNICILAHVDHGKTTLADALIASNGIISDRMIGKMRYMDNLPEEQERGITMKSSSISLLYKNQEKSNLINLVDSPGHVDFCGEVSTATRICDGTLIVIDAVEGVCPQTRTLLRHAWSENLKPLLVFNKIDRLILELKLDPQEIYKHLRQILEHVNAIAGEYFNSKMMQMDEEKQAASTSNIEKEIDESSSIEHEVFDEERLYFNPCSGNVIFASAIDGWAFRIDDFAKIWCQKASISEKVLKKTLWGDYYIDEKSKRVKIGAENKGKKPLFVKMIMENIWSIYDSLSLKNDRTLAQKLIANFKLRISNRDLNHRDPKVLIRSLLQQWLPLSAAVLSAVCSELPASDQISPEKIRGLFDTETSPNLRESSSQIIKTGSIDTDSAVVVFVSKLFAVEKQQIASFNNSRNAESANFRVGFKNGALTDEEVEKLRQRVLDMKNVRFESEIETKSIDEIDTQSSQNVDADRFVLLAFARIYSGTLTAGQNVYVLDENTGGVSGPENQSPFVVESIYSMMGREFLPLQKTYAGNIVALSGEKLIDRLTGKVAALTSPVIDFAPFADLHFYAEPIVRVVVRPKNASDLSKMSEILKFISKIDPMIRTYVEQTGEHILATAGEMHLQKCIDDLTKRYSKLELNFSEPIVPFAETIVKEEEKTAGGGVKKKKNVEMWTANKQISVNVRAAPLPLSIIEILNHNDALLDRIDFAQQNPEALSSKDAEQFLDDVEKFYCELKTAFEKEGKKWKSAHSAVWSFGPRKARCNILFNKIPEYEKNRPNFWQFLYQKITNFSKTERTFDFGFPGSSSSNMRDCDQSFINGFRSLCQAGPLCSEILYGVGFFVENWSQQDDVTTTTTNNTENSCETIDQYGPLSGQLLTTVKEACKASFQAQNQRLMAAMYACTIRCTTEVLGKVYSVLNKRNGKVIGEEMNEGTNLFEISAVLPVIESFGFADEVRKKTSALASPQLVFSHWEVIGVDPFWVPTTQEELEHFGTKADTANRALKYMNMVRKRKGLEVDEQVVEFGTKQRTLIKK